MPSSRLTDKPMQLQALLQFLGSNYPQMAIAFSGGLDSRFLAHAAELAGCRILLLHIRGPHISRYDSLDARKWAANRAFAYAELEVDPLALPEVAVNGRMRCYYCKGAMYAALRRELAARGKGWILCDGGQMDDLQGFRPGARAAAEAGIVSPLALAGLGKNALRALAVESGLDAPDQLASPCLLTRFAYGLRPQADTLAALAKCERELAALADSGAAFRLRLRPEPLLQWSASLHGCKDRAMEIMAKYGFEDAEIEENAQVSGYYDRQAK